MDPSTGWVKRPHHTKGLDPLGVQAPCINIYQQLVPGITNVTDRARYYSFYPWLVWAYNQSGTDRTLDDFVEWIRRGDCLFSMIAVRHRVVSADENLLLHDAGLIGTQTLRSVVIGLDDLDEIELSTYTTREEGDSNRYFKNRLGGLGQYYLGTFAELGLMDRQGRAVGYTPLGEKFASAMDTTVNRDLFVEILLTGRVTAQRLDELSSFCPCHLVASPTEQRLLVDLFFGPDIPSEEHGSHRRASLLLNLDLISGAVASDPEGRYGERVFRECTYLGALPDRHAWERSPEVEGARQSWAVYEANELLSFSAQCVFWVALRTLEESGVELEGSGELGEWFAGSPLVVEAAARLGHGNFKAVLEGAREQCPPLADVGAERHELSLSAALEAARSQDPVSYSNVLTLSGQLLVAVCARSQPNQDPYDLLSFPTDYFVAHPISLRSLQEHAAGTWAGMSLGSWYGWLASRWGVEAHLRVALRKLRAQSRDTFHIAPTDRGLKVLAEPTPTFTTPRFATTNQILQDLGVTARSRDGATTRLTELGKSLRAQS